MPLWGRGNFIRRSSLRHADKRTVKIEAETQTPFASSSRRLLVRFAPAARPSSLYVQRPLTPPMRDQQTSYMNTMFEQMMRSAAALPPVHAQSRPAAMPKPNYEALVEVLSRLYRVPDGLGETILRPEEAAAIRKCGFAARAGTTWRCPPLPDSLVSWNPLLWHLSDAIDPLSRTGTWHPKRAPSRLISERSPLVQIERKILTRLAKGPYYMTKRQLQQKMWRYPARFFNRTIARMIASNLITEYRGYLFPYTRELFAEIVQPKIEALERE